jgi:hypothetical protein
MEAHVEGPSVQQTFRDAEGVGKRTRKHTRRKDFHVEMEQVVPWPLLVLIEPSHYPTPGRRGRSPYALATMLRIHPLQQWYALVSPADWPRPKVELSRNLTCGDPVKKSRFAVNHDVSIVSELKWRRGEYRRLKRMYADVQLSAELLKVAL